MVKKQEYSHSYKAKIPMGWNFLPRVTALAWIVVSSMVVMGLLFGLASCSKDPLERALQGDFLASKNNRIVGNYCRSCHVHKDFAAANHMGNVKAKYKVRKYRDAEECRDCHGVNFKFFGPPHRRTRHPPDGRVL